MPATLAGLWLCVCVVSTGVIRAQDPSRGASHERVPAGFHEFEMFGDTSVFLSHYPMFGSIHAYQVLLEVRLSGQGNDPRQRYLDHKKKNPSARYSLSPETPSGGNDYWVLPEVVKKGGTFRANIHWANTAGRAVYLSRNVTVEIVRIIHFRLFLPDDKKPGVLSYLLFGNSSETFLAHYIGSYPDFDQILAVTIDPNQPRLSESAAASTVVIAGRDNTRLRRLLLKDRSVVGRLNGDGEALRIAIKTLIHLESSLEIQK